MRVAFVHEWLVSFAGSERVLAAALELFPGAPVYTLVHDPAAVAATEIERHPIHTSFIQRAPWGRTHHRAYLPLMPLAVERLDLGDYDVVISSSHAVAKGVLTRADQLHISYVHSPMRYAWDLQEQYLAGLGRVQGAIARAILHYLRIWDAATANRVDVFVANSHYIAGRIRKTYRRETHVIYPPVDVERFDVRDRRDDHYVTVARFVPYKRVDVIVEAFTRLGLPLVAVGDGPDRRAVEQRAGPNVRLVGEQTEAAVKDYVERAKAFVFAAEEDFGIAPVEAQAAGVPVIAYGRGGVTESVVPGETGLFFDAQTPESLMEAVRRFESAEGGFDRVRIRQNAERFSKARFQREFRELTEREWHRFRTERRREVVVVP
jgi:glycosyltransferase involved in cell wall biosynthesis